MTHGTLVASDSFNARNLTPTQVAKTFVPPPEFARLMQPTSAIIVGPRGSGKTTLLKMLQQEALETWSHPAAEEMCASLEYSTAFIATDRRWSKQLDSLGEGGLDPNTRSRFAIAAYTTQVLRALVNAMLERTSEPSQPRLRRIGQVSLGSEREADLTESLASAWHLNPRIPSLIALRQALTERLVEIRWNATTEAGLGVLGRAERFIEQKKYFIPFLDAAVVGIEYFNDFAGERQRRWALAFDELEIAPAPILEELSAAIRAADDQILFKLALSPAREAGTDFESAFGASPGHDFNQIRLWYPDRVDGEAFCRDLWRALLKLRGLPALDEYETLGPSYFEPAPGPTGNDYEPGSKWAMLFNEVAKNDRTFREYLRNKKIDPNALHRMRDATRAADVRKIAPLLPLRDFYRQADRDSPTLGRRRSRKSPTLYTGAACIFAVSEANPRWFKNLFDELVPAISPGAMVDESVQANAVRATAQRFSALLKTAPAPTILHRGAPRGVLGVVREIAQEIHDEHVLQAFKAEPRGTFSVPHDLPRELLSILEEAVNWGAVIHIPDADGQSLLGALIGKRFRVSYLLAPIYGLPVRLGKPLSLHRIFSRRTTAETLDLPLMESPNVDPDSADDTAIE